MLLTSTFSWLPSEALVVFKKPKVMDAGVIELVLMLAIWKLAVPLSVKNMLAKPDAPV